MSSVPLNNVYFQLAIDLLPVITDIVIWNILKFRSVFEKQWGTDSVTAEQINMFNSTILFALSLLISGLRTIEAYGWLLTVATFFVVLSAVPISTKEFKHKRKTRWVIMGIVILLVLVNRFFLGAPSTTPPPSF